MWQKEMTKMDLFNCLYCMINGEDINQERRTNLLRRKEKCSFSMDHDLYALSKHLTT